VNIQSSEDFPTLGGSAQEKVVMTATESTSQGFWELPMRPVKVVEKDDPKAPTPSASRQPQKKAEVASTRDDSHDSRQSRLKDLLKQCGLELEEPMVGFLLTLSSASECLDYLQAYHGDSEAVHRFSEAFVERGLNAASKGKKETAAPAESTPKDKAAKKKRAKGREVDPSLLGFTSLPPPRGGHY